MKKLISTILILAVVLLCFSSCTSVYALSHSKYTDYEGVYITVKGSGPITEGWIEVEWHNETENEVTFGLGYTIEYYEKDQWVNIQISDFAIPEIACILKPGESAEQRYSTKYFNMIREGDYRIKVEFYVQEGDHSVTGTTYAPFAKQYVF